MKLAYNSPKTFVYGNLEELTQIAGQQATKDTLVFNGNTLLTDDDSLDVNVDSSGNVTKTPAKH